MAGLAAVVRKLQYDGEVFIYQVLLVWFYLLKVNVVCLRNKRLLLLKGNFKSESKNLFYEDLQTLKELGVTWLVIIHVNIWCIQEKIKAFR